MFDYIHWRGDLGFDIVPFNPADGVVFSQLSYLPMDGIVADPGVSGSVSVAELSGLYREKPGRKGRAGERDVMVSGAVSVLKAVAAAPRYAGCRLFGYVNNTDTDEEKQFSAFCALIGEKPGSARLLVVFRGTDSSLVGWKEDLNMGFVGSVPAQRQAVRHLEFAASLHPLPIVVTGHSKGGNLAIYSAAFCNSGVQNRVEAVFANDAPGFHPETVGGSGYAAIRPRIRHFVPQSSFVGMLFEHGVAPSVVKSSGVGFAQHNLLSWEVSRDGLADGGELTEQSRLVNGIIREWIGKIGEGRRRQFVQALYGIVAAANVGSLLDLGADWPQSAAGIIGGIRNIDGPTKKMMAEIVGELFRTAKRSITGRKVRSEVSKALWDTDLMNG